MTDSDSTDELAKARALASVSVPYKVLGEIGDVNGVGVIGRNTATSGSGKGVKGVTDATGTASETGTTAGVYGEATGANASGIRYGVYGVSRGGGNTDFDIEGIGVRGESTGASGPAKGVVGIVRTKDTGQAVYAEASNQSGSADALYGRARGNGNALVSDGKARVFGPLEISELGASVYRGSTQSIGDTLEKVRYDQEVVDDRFEYSTSNYVFEVKDRGSYQVEAQIQWDTLPPDGTKLELVVDIDGFDPGIEARSVQFVGSSDASGLTQRVVKTLRNISIGDKISIKARHSDTGNTYPIDFGEANSYLTITRVG